MRLIVVMAALLGSVAGTCGCGGDSPALPAASAGGAGVGTTGGTGGDAPATGSGGGGVTGTGGGNTSGAAGTNPAGSSGGAAGTLDSNRDAGSIAMDARSESSAPPLGDTWESYAKTTFATYCVSCHNDDKTGTASRDYHTLAVVIKEKAEIACGVSKSTADWAARGCSGFPPARQFPVGNGAKPSDAERDRLVRWIDANTP